MEIYKSDNGQFINADCLDAMKDIPDSSVDMILCDLPYGTTACKWDSIISLEKLWCLYKRIAKPNGAMVFTATQPFTTALISSNMENLKHNWIWNKQFAGNFVQAKNMPLRICEDVLAFVNGSGKICYNPQMIKRLSPIKEGGRRKTLGVPIMGPAALVRETSKAKVYDEKFPTDLIEISKRDGSQGIHPTQKPAALFEYLIKTYTNEGDTVLDNCAGSGTTAIAAINTNRKWICIEKDAEYSRLAVERIKAHQKPVDLFS